MNHKLNKDGTPRKRNKDYLNSEEIFYINRHLEKGISYEKIAKSCYCDIADVEAVDKRRLRRSAVAMVRKYA
jgi:hypothetical protein